MLEIKNVHAAYGSDEVLRGISLSVERGEILTLIGENAAGKTTLFKALLGIVRISEGDVLLDGTSILNATSTERAKRIAYLPQLASIPDITVYDLVLTGRFPYLSYPRKYSSRDKRIAERVIELMGLSELSERRLPTLSGGTCRRAYIAMALAQEADVILMDEPTTFLDPAARQMLADTVRRLSEEGRTLLLVLHDLPLAFGLSDRIAVLRDGVIAEIGTSEQIAGSSVINDVFGVRIGTVTENGQKAYYYKSSVPDSPV